MAQDVFLHRAAWWSKSAVAESQRHRRLWQSLSHHFRVAHECPIEFLRTSLGLPEGVLGIVMAIHTFGEYLDFHPHLHALVADGLFARSGVFHVIPRAVRCGV